jgi:invasion protein IalB
MLVVLAATASAPLAMAAPKQDSKQGDWTVFVEDEGGKTCYMVARPTAQSPSHLNWEPTVYITRGAETGGRDEPSVSAGYTYQDGSTVTISIGSDTYTLFTLQDGAWVAEPEPERELIAAMKKGASMVIKGTSARGNVTTDTYSLSGVTAGINRINQLCP